MAKNGGSSQKGASSLQSKDADAIHVCCKGDTPLCDATISSITIRARHDGTLGELLGEMGLSKRIQRRLYASGELVQDAWVARGETIEVPLRQTRLPGPASVEPVEVLWSDRLVLLANKPAGILVHGDGTGAQTLTARVQGLLARKAMAQGWPFVPVAQPVNRLDVQTSGIVLVSLTEEFQPAFDALVATHDPRLVRKRYLCVVQGRFPAGLQSIEAPIARDRHDARRMRVGRTGKPSQTLALRLDYRQGRSLVACELRSGRRHQIRVHLSSMGHPVLGDELYGRSGGSLMLHAHELEFVHPVTGERVMHHTEWPERFAGLFSPREVDWSILGA